jgi:hypothetical protein
VSCRAALRRRGWARSHPRDHNTDRTNRGHVLISCWNNDLAEHLKNPYSLMPTRMRLWKYQYQPGMEGIRRPLTAINNGGADTHTDSRQGIPAGHALANPKLSKRTADA